MLLPFQGATAPTRDTQGVASLALGYVPHWAFSPSLLNPKLEFIICVCRCFGIMRLPMFRHYAFADVSALCVCRSFGTTFAVNRCAHDAPSVASTFTTRVEATNGYVAERFIITQYADGRRSARFGCYQDRLVC